MTELRFVEKLRDIVAGVDVVLSDIWGVVHNGLESFPEACAALHAFRERRGTVILITNAPRPLRPEGTSATGPTSSNKGQESKGQESKGQESRIPESAIPEFQGIHGSGSGLGKAPSIEAAAIDLPARSSGNAALARRLAGPG